MDVVAHGTQVQALVQVPAPGPAALTSPASTCHRDGSLPWCLRAPPVAVSAPWYQGAQRAPWYHCWASVVASEVALVRSGVAQEVAGAGLRRPCSSSCNSCSCYNFNSS